MESGRHCGCDPKAGHVCARHNNARDNTEAEVCEAYIYDGGARTPVIVVVTGPDEDGEFGILTGDVTYLNRFAAEALASELLRRLALMGE